MAANVRIERRRAEPNFRHRGLLLQRSQAAELPAFAERGRHSRRAPADHRGPRPTTRCDVGAPAEPRDDGQTKALFAHGSPVGFWGSGCCSAGARFPLALAGAAGARHAHPPGADEHHQVQRVEPTAQAGHPRGRNTGPSWTAWPRSSSPRRAHPGRVGRGRHPRRRDVPLPRPGTRCPARSLARPCRRAGRRTRGRERLGQDDAGELVAELFLPCVGTVTWDGGDTRGRPTTCGPGQACHPGARPLPADGENNVHRRAGPQDLVAGRPAAAAQSAPTPSCRAPRGLGTCSAVPGGATCRAVSGSGWRGRGSTGTPVVVQTSPPRPRPQGRAHRVRRASLRSRRRERTGSAGSRCW